MDSQASWTERADLLLQRVETATELDDWGNRENVVNTLALVLRGLEEMKYETDPETLRCLLMDITERLKLRLKIVGEINQNPQITKIPIKAPVFIIGNPRTGSTLLHNLISQDPHTRCPLLYEMRYPASDATKEERILNAANFIDEWDSRSPMFTRVHPLKPEAADECTQVLSCDMYYLPLLLASSFATGFASLPLSRKVDVYKFHKSVMQLFDFQSPTPKHEHWTFKSPSHTYNMKAIREVYPDAKFIWIHRDPADVISSQLQLWDAYCGWMFPRDQVEACKVDRAKDILGSYSACLASVCDILDEWEQHEEAPQVVHCKYSDLKADPVAEIRKIYSQLGRNFTAEFEENLKTKYENMQVTRYELRPYSHSLLDTGLTQDSIKSAYSYYLQNYPRFDI